MLGRLQLGSASKYLHPAGIDLLQPAASLAGVEGKGDARGNAGARRAAAQAWLAGRPQKPHLQQSKYSGDFPGPIQALVASGEARTSPSMLA